MRMQASPVHALPLAPAPPRTPRQAARRRDAIDALLDVALFRALADPTRARLLACLTKCARPCGVSEIGACCAVDLSVVSRHLAVLARAGVVRPTRRGREVRYEVRAAELAAALRALAARFDAAGAACASAADAAPAACCPPSPGAPPRPARAARRPQPSDQPSDQPSAQTRRSPRPARRAHGPEPRP
jgi:ArsR family transcriptional regulator